MEKNKENTEETGKRDEEVIRKLELQLHEQYAINNNANVSSVCTLIVATIVVLGFWGYVFVYSKLNYAENLGELACGTSYTLDILLFITIASVIIITVLIYLCIHQGSQQRLEQFIIHAIRMKYYNDNDSFFMVFPKKYHPFGKIDRDCSGKRKKYNLVQGTFGEMAKIFQFLILFVIIGTLIKVLDNVCFFADGGVLCIRGILEVASSIIVLVLCKCIISRKINCEARKYMKRCHYYNKNCTTKHKDYES